MIKYFVHPGKIMSNRDGDIHYISHTTRLLPGQANTSKRSVASRSSQNGDWFKP